MATIPPGGQRHLTLDTVRGVAVMGILLLNIVAFSMPEAAYINPRAYGGATGADLVVYLINYVLFDGKMRGLFSFLFGASTLLVIERAKAAGTSPARIHYARMFWLLVFGYIHLLLIWWGDILVHYAMMGMILWFFRKMPAHRLGIVAVLLLALELAIMSSIPLWAWAIEHGHAGTPEETAKQAASLATMVGVPDAAKLAADLALYRGDYAGILSHRVETKGLLPIPLFLYVGAETLAYMLIGMAGLRSGMLTGAWPRARYVRWLIVSFGIAIPAYVACSWYMLREDFSMFAMALCVMAIPVLFRPLMILGWACAIILLMRPGGALTARIAAAGRMAFTNYLMTSVLCTLFFYGYGLGWYGYLSRFQIYGVVFAIWALMLLWSKPWLTHFRYGPLEWLWRSLSRGRVQPIRGGAIATG